MASSFSMWARVRNQVILTRSPESIQTRTPEYRSAAKSCEKWCGLVIRL